MEKYDQSSKQTIEEFRSAHPEIIRDVAMTTTVMPPTQVSDRFASLKDGIAETILYLRISCL